MKIGKYKFKSECRFCQSKNIYKFLDFGFMPHAGDFLNKFEIGKEKYYPLRIFYCKKCYLVQVLDIPDPKDLFTNYKYASTYSLKNYFEKYAIKLSKLFKRNDFIIEIGCNDGVLLKPLKELGARVLGIDPAILIKDKKVLVENKFFNEKTSKFILKKYGKADVILASNVMAHIDDMTGVLKGIKNILKPSGVFIFEVHYLPSLINNMQYDFFYNEHLSYYTLTTLKRFFQKFGLTLTKVENTKVHGGSIRVYVKIDNVECKINNSVQKMLDYEKSNGFLKLEKYKNFAREVEKSKISLLNKIIKLKSNNNKLVGYGASGRANTILNYCGITSNMINYIVDESPLRAGKYTPGVYIPIKNLDYFKNDKNIRNVILFAGAYKKQIIDKNKEFIKRGGRFISPM